MQDNIEDGVSDDTAAEKETPVATEAAETTTEETPNAQTEDAELTKSEPEKKEQPNRELEGISNEKESLLKQVQDLRLEKRTLAGEPATTTKTVAEGDEYLADLEQKLVQEHVAPLQEKLTAIEKAYEKSAINEFSSSEDYPLIHKAKDTNNQNWNKMMTFYVSRHGKATPEAIKADLDTAYWAAFGKEHLKLVEEKAKYQGMAEATASKAADIGTGSGAPKKPSVQLTPKQREVAKKMGLSDEQYLEGVKLRENN